MDKIKDLIIVIMSIVIVILVANYINEINEFEEFKDKCTIMKNIKHLENLSITGSYRNGIMSIRLKEKSKQTKKKDFPGNKLFKI